MSHTLEDPSVDQLARLIEEATRSTDEGVRFFVEPARGTLSRCTTKRHHLIFGRRGSGKTSLLKKAASDLTLSRRPIAFVDLEEFKGHSYPDVLISILLKSFQKFKEWLDTAAVYPANKSSWWEKWFGAAPKIGSFNREDTKEISALLDQHIGALQKLLDSPLQSDTAIRATDSMRDQASLEANIGAKALGVDASTKGAASSTTEQRTSTDKKFVETKGEALGRKIMTYKEAFEKIAKLSDGPGFLMLDDLYHIRLDDQAKVVDYFHRIVKNTNIWLKIGTVRHRSSWYVNSSPPIGMKLTDDADDIDLDVTLEKFDITKKFLLEILSQFIGAVSLSIDDVLTDGARDRLVLASGGVARDFLSIFRRSIDVTRERLAQGNLSRGERIGAEDVNMAAGEYDDYKREEFSSDTQENERNPLTEFLEKIRSFCLDEKESNCILVEKDLRNSETRMIDELVDLKFLHRINSRVTVRNRQGRIYEAFMLDLSQYVGARKQRNLELIEFWRADRVDSLRKSSVIFLERPWER